jgi:hypothetical protein
MRDLKIVDDGHDHSVDRRVLGYFGHSGGRPVREKNKTSLACLHRIDSDVVCAQRVPTVIHFLAQEKFLPVEVLVLLRRNNRSDYFREYHGLLAFK